jgi:hypothetical protein
MPEKIDAESQPITLRTLILWGTIFSFVVGAIGTAVTYYVGLRMDVTVAQHDIETNRESIVSLRTKQEATDAKLNEIDKKVTEVVTILRRLDNAKSTVGLDH